MLKYWWLTKKGIVNLIPLLHKYFTFVFLHELLQGIVRSNNNRSKFFSFVCFGRFLNDLG